jgi:hypothetical protein
VSSLSPNYLHKDRLYLQPVSYLRNKGDNNGSGNGRNAINCSFIVSLNKAVSMQGRESVQMLKTNMKLDEDFCNWGRSTCSPGDTKRKVKCPDIAQRAVLLSILPVQSTSQNSRAHYCHFTVTPNLPENYFNIILAVISSPVPLTYRSLMAIAT